MVTTLEAIENPIPIEPPVGDRIAVEDYLAIEGRKNEAKKQGLIQDWKVFVQERTNPNDWDIAVATLHSSYGRALDYSAADEAKWDAIQAETWKTADRDKQNEAAAPRGCGAAVDGVAQGVTAIGAIT